MDEKDLNLRELLEESLSKHVPLPLEIAPTMRDAIVEDITQKVVKDIQGPMFASLSQMLQETITELIDVYLAWHATESPEGFRAQMIQAKQDAIDLMSMSLVTPDVPHAHTEHGCICGGHA